MKKLIYLFAILATIAVSTSCEFFDHPEPQNVTPITSELPSDKSDTDGNLLFQNGSGYRLAFYNGDSLWRIIPASLEDFLVTVPNPDNHTNDLILKKFVTNDSISAEIFKRWTIPLAGDNEVEHRCTWIITDNDEELYSGTINFSYFDTENYVEVFLNSRNGALIRKLKPGDQYIGAVGIDYGTYTLLYRYLFSDPNTPDGQIELGWIETQVINDVEENIWVVFNQDRTKADIVINPWNGGGAFTQTYGQIKITNLLTAPIQIWTNSQTLIENIIFTDGTIINSSTIPYNGTSTYTVPVGNYIFNANKLPYASFVADTTLTITSDTIAVWIVQ